MKDLVAILLVVPTTLLLFACRHQSNIELIPSLQEERSYFDELKNWQKTRKVYGELDVRSYIEVTYFSKQLARAYVKEMAKLYNLTLDRQSEMLEEELEKRTTRHIFFVSIFAPEESWTQLSVDDRVWKLRASQAESVGESNAVKPLSVVELSLEDVKISHFLPYAEPWSKHYRIEFKRSEPVSMVAFRLQGVIADATFVWSVQP